MKKSQLVLSAIALVALLSSPLQAQEAQETEEIEAKPRLRISKNIDACGTAVRAEAKNNRASLLECYESSLKEDETLVGKITVDLSIVEGKLIDANISKNETENVKLGKCIKKSVRKWEFPESCTVAYGAVPLMLFTNEPPKTVIPTLSSSCVDNVRSVVGANYGKIRYCYERRLKQKPDLDGRIILKTDIYKGVVREVVVTEDTTEDAVLSECVQQHVQVWTFDNSCTDPNALLPFAFSPFTEE